MKTQAQVLQIANNIEARLKAEKNSMNRDLYFAYDFTASMLHLLVEETFRAFTKENISNYLSSIKNNNNQSLSLAYQFLAIELEQIIAG